MILHDLQSRRLISPPKWLPDNVLFLTYMGSTVYGTSGDNSDADVYGYVMPPKADIFPHLKGEIPGFGRQIQRFEVWQEHHVQDGPREWDFSLYGVVKYFQLVMENNPNMLETLFVNRNHIIHSTAISEMVRERRSLFLHRGLWHKFRGYAFANLSKIRGKVIARFWEFCQKHNIDDTIGKKDVLDFIQDKPTPYGEGLSRLPQTVVEELLGILKQMPEVKSSRFDLVKRHGYDTKYAAHTVRLMLEAEQLLHTGELILDRDAAMLRAIRQGEWTLERVEEFFSQKERTLEDLYNASSLPMVPDEDAIKSLLLECIEQHYGSLSGLISLPDRGQKLFSEMEELLNRYRGGW